MKLNRWMVTAAIIAVYGAGSEARADETTDTIKALKERIEQLDQKVRVLERKNELEGETPVAKSSSTPRITIDSAGFNASSADTNFVMKLRGGFQVDGRFFPGDESPGKDTFLLRRLRPIIEGTVFRDFDYRVMLDFGTGVSSSTFNNGNVVDAYINYRLLPELQFQVGKFKEPVGLERLQSWQNLLFIERGLPTLLVPNRDTGLQIHGDVGSGLLQYAVGYFNGTEEGASSDFDTDNDKDVAARIFAHPFKNSGVDALKGLGLGVAGTWGNHEGPLRSITTLGQQPFFSWTTGAGTNAARPNVSADGTLWRLAPQAYYYWGPFGVFGEYVIASHEVRRDTGGQPARATLRNTAWQVAGSWFLTGEQNAFRAVAPSHNFDPFHGGWGSLELAARIGELEVDDDAFPLYANPNASAGGILSWGVGVNWRLNKNIKLSLDYEHAELMAAKGGKPPFDEEEAVFVRAQFGF